MKPFQLPFHCRELVAHQSPGGGQSAVVEPQVSGEIRLQLINFDQKVTKLRAQCQIRMLVNPRPFRKNPPERAFFFLTSHLSPWRSHWPNAPQVRWVVVPSEEMRTLPTVSAAPVG
ncbi:hypothetical protein [Streptomyces thermoalcalitolerans]|uniref:Uncharacterized protein n=1 Tax=Streptomyces thermoalcalitolerans TaxID=65605 RepID=A0ABP3ZPR9_9ACTN